MNYYNEYEPKAAAWLRQLIKDGLVPNGTVDTRSIKDVQPSDLKGFTQCHFFAGIGGWSRALQLAGWSSDVPVWTGSCPCQPFSVTGLKKGTADERHLWPEFFRLIRECSPSVVFGEQVAKKAGRKWLAGVFSDLQGAGYRTAGADLSGASIGAPHIRQRLYWVGERWSVGDQRRMADADSEGLQGHAGHGDRGDKPGREQEDQIGHDSPSGDTHVSEGWKLVSFAGDCAGGDEETGELGYECSVCGGDYTECPCPGPTQEEDFEYKLDDGILFARRLADSISEQEHEEQQRPEDAQGGRDSGIARGCGVDSGGGDSESDRLERSRELEKPTRRNGVAHDGANHWSDVDWLPCRDGKTRRVESGLEPLAHWVPARVVRLSGYGNAIIPPLAATFIEAWKEI